MEAIIQVIVRSFLLLARVVSGQIRKIGTVRLFS